MTDGTPAATAEEDPFITLMIGGEAVRIDRAKARALGQRMRAGPDGGSAGIFTAMAGLPGSEVGPPRSLDPKGPEDPPADDAA